ncbi:MAG: FG-GAP repeat protein [Thermomicrobiales bacterium]
MKTTHRRSYRGILILLSVSLVFVAPLLLAWHTGPRSAPASPASPFATLPASFLTRVNSDLADDDPAYAFAPTTATTLHAINPAQQLAITFGPDGVTVNGQDTAPWRLALVGVSGTMATPATPVIAGERVEYRRGGLTEWYMNGPVGVEQGFTLATPPAAGGTVTLTLAVDGATPMLAGTDVSLTLPNGDALRYGRLTVTDALGERLPARLDAHDGTIAIIVATAGAVWPITVDPFIETHALTANDPAYKDQLGVSVAVDAADDVVVAGTQHKTVNGKTLQGAVYVWHLSSPTTPTKLTASDGASGDLFGDSVAVSADGSVVVVGAYLKTVSAQARRGEAYVYSGLSYATETKVFASDGAAGDLFGSSVSITGNASSVAVGASGQNGGKGKVYLKSGGGYVLETPITASDGATNDLFGSSVAYSSDGSKLVVGAPDFSVTPGSTEGKIYLYTIPGLAEKGIIASDSDVSATFGSSVAVNNNGSVVVVGAPGQTISFFNQGEAYIYTGPTYATETKIIASGGAAGDNFGYAVAVNGSGSAVAIGSFNKNTIAVYSGTSYAMVQTVKGTAPSGTHFGDSVAMSADGGTLAGGAPLETVGAISQAGKVHVFTIQTPLPLPHPRPSVPPQSGARPLPATRPPGALNSTPPAPLPPSRPCAC